ncbi:MAG TPA: phage baseplate assembly protein V [Bryobacteraceae bacterium]|nr:phage baseplate assembly protein V [Bryobacteraceae bacterium]
MSQICGVVPAIVMDVHDPDGIGRVLINYAWVGEGQTQGYWAPVATLMSGGGRGSWVMPEVGDEVLVAFEHGDVNHPYIIGFIWNGKDKPPATDPQRRLIHSVNGHEIELYDPGVQDGDKGYIRIKDAHGNFIELSNAEILIRSVGTVSIEGAHVFINRRRVVITSGDI